MRRFIVLAAVLLASMAVMAEEKMEVFGGWQFVSSSYLGQRNTVVKGWDADVSYKAFSEFSLIGDVSGSNKDGIKVHTFMGGARVRMKGRRISPFAEGLFGAAHLGSFGAGGGTKMSMAFGGGVDYNLGRNLAIRLAKVDYNIIRIEGGSMKNIRFATGVVLKF